MTGNCHVRVHHEARSSSGVKPTLSHRRVNLTRQAKGPSSQPSEALGTRPEPPSLEEGWRAKVESRYGQEHEPAMTGTRDLWKEADTGGQFIRNHV